MPSEAVRDTRRRGTRPASTASQRPREWDDVVDADAPTLEGDAREFVVLEDEVIVDEDGPDDAVDAARRGGRARSIRRTAPRA